MEPEATTRLFSGGTNGAIALNGITICATNELPWKNNSARVACIPEEDAVCIAPVSIITGIAKGSHL